MASGAAISKLLSCLSSAQERLKIFKADLLEEGSFDEAISGCKYVIHAATPVLLRCKPHEAMAKLVDPALKGTRNVLETVNRTSSGVWQAGHRKHGLFVAFPPTSLGLSTLTHQP